MRLALVSDVHGDSMALQAVLADVAQRAVDLIVDLGDLASGGVDPGGTVALLRSVGPQAVHVRGNHERQLLNLPRDGMGLSDRLAHDRLAANDNAWLATLPATAAPVPGVLAFHATPDDDTQYLMHTVTPTGLREATDAEIAERLGAHRVRHTVFVCGHTHLQGDRRLPDGRLIVNPGSVGWPAYDDDHPYPHVVEAGSPHARYSLIERAGDEQWHVTPVALNYNVEQAADLATANGRADVAYALRHGRVRPSGTPTGALQTGVRL